MGSPRQQLAAMLASWKANKSLVADLERDLKNFQNRLNIAKNDVYQFEQIIKTWVESHGPFAVVTVDGVLTGREVLGEVILDCIPVTELPGED